MASTKTFRSRFRCGECSRSFSSSASLQKHVAGKHVVEQVDHTEHPMSSYKCNVCSKIFSNGQALGGHRRIHRANPQSKKRKRAGEPSATSFDWKSALRGDESVSRQAKRPRKTRKHIQSIDESIPIHDAGHNRKRQMSSAADTRNGDCCNEDKWDEEHYPDCMLTEDEVRNLRIHDQIDHRDCKGKCYALTSFVRQILY